MNGRAFQRIPYAVQVEFRTASSFLVAYSVNISRGGIFLETEYLGDIGSRITLQFAVPGTGPISLVGEVVWRREPGSEDGPPGVGIEFDELDEDLGEVIDRLVARFEGLQVLVLAPRQPDRASLARLVRSIVSTTEVDVAADAHEAETKLTTDLDMVIVDTDEHTEEALRVVRKAKSNIPPIPVIALASNPKGRARAHAAGADEITPNPPSFAEFQTQLVRALSRPINVR